MDHQLLHRRLQRRLHPEDDDLGRRQLPPTGSPTSPGPIPTTDPKPTTNPPATTPSQSPPPPPPTTAPSTTSANPSPSSQSSTTSSASATTSSSSSSVTSSSVQTATGQTSLTPNIVTATGPAPVLSYTSHGALTTFVTPTISSDAPTPTNSSGSNGSGTNIGGIIGGVAAALLGLTVLTFGIKYLVRRRNRRHDDDAFNPNEFRRSAVLIDDPPTHAETVARGYNPRPPTMIERKLIPPPSTFGNQYGGHGGGGGGNSYGDYNGVVYPNYSQFAPPPPGDMMHSAQPSYPENAYVSPITNPLPSPGLTNPYDAGYDESSQAPNPYLTRQPSAGAGTHFAAGPADYVVLDRASPTGGHPAPPNVQHPSDFTGRPSEEYAHAVTSSGYTLPPPAPLANEHQPRASEDHYGVAVPRAGAHGATSAGQRPVSSIYNEGDAYAGI